MKAEVAAISAEIPVLTIFGINQPAQDGIVSPAGAESGDFLLALMAAMTQQSGAEAGTQGTPHQGQPVVTGVLPEIIIAVASDKAGTSGSGGDAAAGGEIQGQLSERVYIIPDYSGFLPMSAPIGPPEAVPGISPDQAKPASPVVIPVAFAPPGVESRGITAGTSEAAGTTLPEAVETAGPASGHNVQPPAEPGGERPVKYEVSDPGKTAQIPAGGEKPAKEAAVQGISGHPGIQAERTRPGGDSRPVSLNVISGTEGPPEKAQGLPVSQVARPLAGEVATFGLPAAGGVEVREAGMPVVSKVMDQAVRPGAENGQPAKEAGTPNFPAAVDMEGLNNRQADAGGNQEGQPQWRPGRENAAEGGEIPPVARDGGREITGSGSTPMSSVTPKKFPEVVLPHFVSSLRSMSADQARVTVIRLKLEPENMGEIKIRLSYAKGELTAHFFTSSGLVKDAVECSLPQLRETLAQHNVSLGEAAAFIGQEQQGQRWANFRGSGYEQRENPAISGDFQGETLNKAYSGENSLDLFI